MKQHRIHHLLTKLLITIFAALSLLALTPAQAQEKHALVIGNANYKFAPLRNPVNDARAMARTLRLKTLGFKVTELHNRSRKQMASAIRNFGQSIRPGGVAVVYFSGHGAQYQGENYLFPVDFNTQYEDELPTEAVGTKFIMDKLSANVNGLNILILDACRDNPLQKQYKSNSKGLTRTENAPPNTYSIFATGPGQVASDNNQGKNGLFTKYFIQQIQKPGLDLGSMMIETRKQVMKASSNKQVPYDYGTLTDRFCFAGCATTANASVVPTAAVIATRPAQPAVVTVDPNQHVHNGRTHSHPLPATGKNHQHGDAKPAVPAQPVRVETGPRPAVTQRRDPREPEMVLIRGGTFTMGSPASEKDRYGNEKPHSVRVSNFYLGKTEVTNAEYARCVGAGGCKPPEWQEVGSDFNLKTGPNNLYQGFTDPQQPVVGVSWDNAMAYANWLSGISGKRYGLPTEAQWEYAARAGSQTAYHWGNEIARNQANCNGCGSQWDGKTTAPVGRFAANRFGLHDMLGNVWEWTCSEYDKNYAGAKEQRCVASGSRALRGGSWSYIPRFVRSAYRYRFTPSDRYFDVGFRLSRTP